MSLYLLGDKTTACQVSGCLKSGLRRWYFISLGGVILTMALLLSRCEVIKKGYDQPWAAYSASFGIISLLSLWRSKSPYQPMMYLPLLRTSPWELSVHSYALIRHSEYFRPTWIVLVVSVIVAPFILLPGDAVVQVIAIVALAEEFESGVDFNCFA